jgi:hypothetical protein
MNRRSFMAGLIATPFVALLSRFAPKAKPRAYYDAASHSLRDQHHRPVTILPCGVVDLRYGENRVIGLNDPFGPLTPIIPCCDFRLLHDSLIDSLERQNKFYADGNLPDLCRLSECVNLNLCARMIENDRA